MKMAAPFTLEKWCFDRIFPWSWNLISVLLSKENTSSLPCDLAQLQR